MKHQLHEDYVLGDIKVSKSGLQGRQGNLPENSDLVWPGGLEMERDPVVFKVFFE